ncbi:M48 family metalloprotease, partial [Ramlibacter sp. MAHUQ-53]|uniref:M48 family metalloprotease n=1 Tax=unclassified Ramlibacter TaxID=2617605 RepID=UPI00362DF6EA
MKHSMIRAPRTRALALLLALGLAVPPVPAQLPALGDGGDLSVSTERRIGDRVARELFRDPDYLDDPILSDYLDSLWQPLLAAARQRGDLGPDLDQRYAWRLLLGRDRSINAFAVPGGWMGVHLGLIAATTTRDELASVLAHELTHVTQRHISRMVTQDKRQAPWTIAAVLLGALAASRSPDAASALITGGQALAIQNQLSFSREMEREADRIGFAVMTQAGFAPQGFASMFEKLQQASRLNDNGSYPYLRTHPLTTERVADMRSRTQLGARAAPLPPDLQHALMAGRARGLSAAGVDRQRAVLQEALAQRADGPAARQAGALYAGVVAASRLREPAQARALAAR